VRLIFWLFWPNVLLLFDRTPEQKWVHKQGQGFSQLLWLLWHFACEHKISSKIFELHVLLPNMVIIVTCFQKHTHTHTHTHRLRRILCIILWTILFQSQSWVTLLCNVGIVIKLCTFWKGKICFMCFASLENIMSAPPNLIHALFHKCICDHHPSLQVHQHSW